MKARRFATRPGVHAYVLGFVAWFVAAIAMMMVGRNGDVPPAAVVCLPMLAGLLVTLLKWPPSFQVGADGISVGHLLRREFIPVADITNVESFGSPQPTGIRVYRRGGAQPRELVMVGMTAVIPVALDAIDDVVRTAREKGSRPLAALDRAGRSIDAWRSDVRGLIKGGFRDAALTADDLGAILDDPTAKLEHRVAAALALRDDSGARTRIRIAAEQTAEPRLRVALTAAAADEEEAMADIEGVMLVVEAEAAAAQSGRAPSGS